MGGLLQPRRVPRRQPGRQGEDRPDNIGCFNTTLRKGQFWITARTQYSTCNTRVERSRSTDDRHPRVTRDGETWRYTWSLFKDTMTWKKDCVICPTGLAVKPFHRLADAQP